MAVLSVPVSAPFEVDKTKVKEFDKVAEEKKGKKILHSRLLKHDRGDVEWQAKK